jgi:OsmC-like protein
MSESEFVWSTRLRGVSRDESQAYARTHTFAVGRQASFRDLDRHPSAVELLLGALGGDLLSGWYAEAERAGVVLDGLEVSLSGRLDNPLRHLGVEGEAESAGIATIEGSLYVTADAGREALDALWVRVLERSPLYSTLSRCLALTLELRVIR